MIRMIQSSSAGHAKAYFSEALLKSDYYIGDQELNGTFRGELSERLGITGMATRDRFFALCENRHPDTGLPLTPRTKKDRTIGYDLNFHVPKSVSILHALAQDNHILDAFQASVADTMKEIEAEARVRVRKGGGYADRKTGELLWVDFIHQTSRPVEGFVPDPHLHAHCYVFNMTWDETEKQLKAAQFREINKEMPYYQSMFHKRLANRLIDLGYRIKPTAKAFEVLGVPQEAIELFSKRTDEIGRIAKEKDITDAKELDGLGARSRSKKQKGLSMEELRADWQKQLDGLQEAIREHQDTGKEDFEIDRDKDRTPALPEAMPPYLPVLPPSRQRELTAGQCVAYTLSHCFERASVVPYRKLMQIALEYSLGSTASPEAIQQGFEAHPQLIRIAEGDTLLCTTKEVLQEEQRMVQFAREGKDRFAPLYVRLPDIQATGQQGEAIRHILTTTDRVSIVRGAAGTGKTTLMKEAIGHIENAGKKVFTVAPTARASRGVLREEGFSKAETVASLLTDKAKQQQLRGQVLWVDEAGMLGTKDMLALLELTTEQKARLILGGDTRQHASVVRGDALRILNTVAGIPVAEVNKIYRQKDEAYRHAIGAMSKGDIREGFARLDGIGAIKQLDKPGAYADLVDGYVNALQSGKDVLAISPTHAQGERVNDAIRQKLRQEGLLGKKELTAEKLKNLNLTAAEKTDAANFQPGWKVRFNQNQKGIKRGSRWTVDKTTENEVRLINDAKEKRLLNLGKPEDFDVYQSSGLALSKGDKVQITHNGFDLEKRRLNNGTVFDVTSVSQRQIVLSNGKTQFRIGTDYGHLAHAHCVTSHASQGKTVDEIFIAQPSSTFAATNAKQFYVSTSRAREKVHVYTDDKKQLLAYAASDGDRKGATELMRSVTELMHIRQMEQEHVHQFLEQEKQHEPQQPDHSLNYEDYEPGF